MPKIDLLLRAQFKETARTIIAKDRSARRHGYSQNTIGAITSALVKAYLLGSKGQQFPVDKSVLEGPSFVQWELIPSRSRDTLSRMSFGMSQRLGSLYQGHSTEEVEIAQEQSSRRWQFRNPDNDRISCSTISDGAVNPLIRMSLLEVVPDRPDAYRLSKLGMETCREYWRRADNDDQSLPEESLRG